MKKHGHSTCRSDLSVVKGDLSFVKGDLTIANLSQAVACSYRKTGRGRKNSRMSKEKMLMYEFRPGTHVAETFALTPAKNFFLIRIGGRNFSDGSTLNDKRRMKWQHLKNFNREFRGSKI